MARFLKAIALLIGLLAVLIVLAGLILPQIIDVNEHKDRISLEIEKATGYQVVMEGDIELSLIPWIGLSLGRTHVANPPEFGDEPMAALDELQIRVRFWPLLVGRFEADNIVLNGFELALVKNELGNPNWIIPRDEEELTIPDQEARDKEIAEQDIPATPVMPELNIQGLQIANAAISYQDRQNNQAFFIRDMNLKTGKISLDSPFEIEADLSLESADPDIQSSFKFSTLVTFESQSEAVRLENFLLNFNLQGEAFASPIRDASLKADVVYELADSALHLNSLDLDVLDARIKGRVAALNLDGTPDISFQINGRDLNVDKILAQSPEGGNRNPSVQQSPGAPQGPDAQGTEPIDLSFLSDFNLDGQADLTEMTISGLKLDSLSATVKSGGGKMSISPLIVHLYQGVQQSEISLEDVRGALHIHSVQSLDDLQMGPFIRDLSQKDIITGTARVRTDTRTWGINNDQFVANMSGKAELELSDGVIKGVDIEKMIREVFALASGEIGSVSENGGETGFTRMGADFNINNGVAVSDNLAMNSPVLALKGDMTADLPRSQLDSRSQISLDGALRDELVSRYNLRQVSIPLRVRGPFDDLSFGLDSEAIIRSLVQDRGEEALRGILEQIAPQNDTADDKIPDDPADLLRRLIPGR